MPLSDHSSHNGDELPSTTVTVTREEAGEWCAVCRLEAPNKKDLSRDQMTAVRTNLSEVAAVTSVRDCQLVLSFEVSGDLAQATARAVSLLWDTMETVGLEHLRLLDLQLVPEAEVSGGRNPANEPVPYYARGELAQNLLGFRTDLESFEMTELLDRSEVPKADISDANKPSCSDLYGDDPPGDESGKWQWRFLEQYPCLNDHRWTLGTILEGLIEEKQNEGESSPELCAEIALSAMHYVIRSILRDGDGLAGSTEAAGYLGVSRQRMCQISHEEIGPFPIARVAGKRPLWLVDDLEQMKGSR